MLNLYLKEKKKNSALGCLVVRFSVKMFDNWKNKTLGKPSPGRQMLIDDDIEKVKNPFLNQFGLQT